MSKATNHDVKERLQKELGLTEEDFGGHASDLYVLAKPGVMEWLRDNYAFPSIITTFNGNGPWEGKLAIDIPFGRMVDYFEGK